MKSAQLSKRLSLAASMVREGACLADIGTDHGYLPIALLSSGRIKSAVLADINEGPLLRAKENVEAEGLSDRVSLVLTDGASAIEGMGASDFAICGMGGELIAAIISRSPFLFNPDYNFILQPMTRPEKLRQMLWESGFEIVKEAFCFDGGKHYLCINARYTGETVKYTDFDAYFGKNTQLPIEGERREYLLSRLSAMEKALLGKRRGNEDFAEDEKLTASLRELLFDRNTD